jgi:methyl-accepting chemotaxis protein
MWIKMMIAPCIATLFLILLAIVSYKGISNQNAAINDMFNQRFAIYQRTAHMIERIMTIHKDIFKVLGLLGAGADEEKARQLGQDVLNNIVQMKEYMRGISGSTSLSEEERQSFETSLKDVEDYEAMVKQSLTVSMDDTSLAITMLYPIENKFKGLCDRMQQLLEMEYKLSEGQYASSKSSYEFVMRSFIVVLSIAVLLSFVVTIAMARMVTSPIEQTVSIIKDIAEGDLTRELSVSSGDEIGELVRAVNAMRIKMGEAVGQCARMSVNISDAASRQAAALEETSSSLEEMSSMTKNNAENTDVARSLMSSAQGMIEKANASMNHLTESMGEIADASLETQKIIKSIDEISFRTNLLALNAAVEAARAGEAGAGFSVVAEEVRSLARQAAEAAGNTTSLIENIVTRVKRGNDLVGATHEVFGQISDGTTKVLELVNDIAMASREQTQGIEQVNLAVADMNTLTQGNASHAYELASIMSIFKTAENNGAGGAQDTSARKASPVYRDEERAKLPNGRRAQNLIESEEDEEPRA